jgi:hypothetical protein
MSNNRNALGDFSITREAFEEILGKSVTDSQWESIADEIDGRVDNYLDELLPMLVDEILEGDWE